LGLLFEISSDPSRAVSAVALAEKEISGSLAQVQTAGIQSMGGLGAASEKAEYRIGEAKMAMRGLGAEVGVAAPRYVSAWLASLEGIGPAMAAAFSTIAIIGLIQMLAVGIEHLTKFIGEIGRLSAEEKKLFEENAKELEKVRDLQVEILKAKFAEKLAGLEGVNTAQAHIEKFRLQLQLNEALLGISKDYVKDVQQRLSGINAEIAAAGERNKVEAVFQAHAAGGVALKGQLVAALIQQYSGENKIADLSAQQLTTLDALVKAQMARAAAVTAVTKSTGDLAAAERKAGEAVRDRMGEMLAALRLETAALGEEEKPLRAIEEWYLRKRAAAEKDLEETRKAAQGRIDAAKVVAAAEAVYGDVLLEIERGVGLKLQELQKQTNARLLEEQARYQALSEHMRVEQLGRMIAAEKHAVSEFEKLQARRIKAFLDAAKQLEHLEMQVVNAARSGQYARVLLLRQEEQAIRDNDAIRQASIRGQIRDLDELAYHQQLVNNTIVAWGMVLQQVAAGAGKHCAAIAAAQIAGMVVVAAVKIHEEVAAGLAAAAWGDYWAAALHFASAAQYGIVAGQNIAAAAASVGGGGGGIGAGAGAAGGAAGSAASPASSLQSPASSGPRISIVVNGHIIGASGIEELTDIINDAVQNRDVRLVATQTRQLQPATAG
jgi:hypothetical protein